MILGMIIYNQTNVILPDDAKGDCLYNITSVLTYYQCRVISFGTMETEAAYCGFKSIINNFILKEQRADGSLHFLGGFGAKTTLSSCIRFTLAYFAKYYKVRTGAPGRNKVTALTGARHSYLIVRPNSGLLRRPEFKSDFRLIDRKVFFSSKVPKSCIEKMNSCVKNINPWFITGFSDGEGCFSINILRNSEIKIG